MDVFGIWGAAEKWGCSLKLCPLRRQQEQSKLCKLLQNPATRSKFDKVELVPVGAALRGGSFHLKVIGGDGKTRKYNFAPGSAKTTEADVVLRLIRTY